MYSISTDYGIYILYISTFYTSYINMDSIIFNNITEKSFPSLYYYSIVSIWYTHVLISDSVNDVSLSYES